jgi:hypothetical protein
MPAPRVPPGRLSASLRPARAANSSHPDQNYSVLSDGKRASFLHRPSRTQAFEKRSSLWRIHIFLPSVAGVTKTGPGTRYASDVIEPQPPPGTPPGSRFAKHPHLRSDGSPRMDVGSRAVWAEPTSASPGHGVSIGKPAGAGPLALRPHPLGGLSPATRLGLCRAVHSQPGLTCLVVVRLRAAAVLCRKGAAAGLTKLSENLVRMNLERAQGPHAYRRTRIYRVEYRGFPTTCSAEMVVDVKYQSPGTKELTIQSATGSRIIIDKVFKRLCL